MEVITEICRFCNRDIPDYSILTHEAHCERGQRMRNGLPLSPEPRSPSPVVEEPSESSVITTPDVVEVDLLDQDISWNDTPDIKSNSTTKNTDDFLPDYTHQSTIKLTPNHISQHTVNYIPIQLTEQSASDNYSSRGNPREDKKVNESPNRTLTNSPIHSSNPVNEYYPNKFASPILNQVDNDDFDKISNIMQNNAADPENHRLSNITYDSTNNFSKSKPYLSNLDYATNDTTVQPTSPKLDNFSIPSTSYKAQSDDFAKPSNNLNIIERYIPITREESKELNNKNIFSKPSTSYTIRSDDITNPSMNPKNTERYIPITREDSEDKNTRIIPITRSEIPDTHSNHAPIFTSDFTFNKDPEPSTSKVQNYKAEDFINPSTLTSGKNTNFISDHASPVTLDDILKSKPHTLTDKTKDLPAYPDSRTDKNSNFIKDHPIITDYVLKSKPGTSSYQAEEKLPGLTCPDCHRVQKPGGLRQHLDEDCPLRSTSCTFCSVAMRARDLECHMVVCGTKSERCPECEEMIMLKYKHIHLESNHGFIKLDDEPENLVAWAPLPRLPIRPPDIIRNIPMSMKEDEARVEIPCEFCDQKFPAFRLTVHQLGCRLKQQTSAKTSNKLKNAAPKIPGTEQASTSSKTSHDIPVYVHSSTPKSSTYDYPRHISPPIVPPRKRREIRIPIHQHAKTAPLLSSRITSPTHLEVINFGNVLNTSDKHKENGFNIDWKDFERKIRGNDEKERDPFVIPCEYCSKMLKIGEVMSHQMMCFMQH